MVLKRLSTAEMIQLSTPWVTEGAPARKLLKGVPEVTAILPRLEEAHRTLLAEPPPVADVQLVAIASEANDVDSRHDALARGIYWSLTAAANLTQDVGRAEEYLLLRMLLLPEGLSATQKSYREEAEAAAALGPRLTDETKTLLEGLPVSGGTLALVVDEWMVTAKRLGELESRRVEALHELASGPSVSGGLEARNRWIRAVNALVSSLELAELDRVAMAKILGPLWPAHQEANAQRE